MSSRPVLSVPKSTQALALNVAATAGLIATLAIAVHAWFVLPDIIPIHFGISGQPNGWGSKATLWMLPILAII
ncbi:MAG: hypothetical protein NVSMB70_10610 [Chamaesiphon sp.]